MQIATAAGTAPARDYHAFLAKKSQLGGSFGFEPTFLPPCLFDFQRHLVEWAVRNVRDAAKKAAAESAAATSAPGDAPPPEPDLFAAAP